MPGGEAVSEGNVGANGETRKTLKPGVGCERGLAGTDRRRLFLNDLPEHCRWALVLAWLVMVRRPALLSVPQHCSGYPAFYWRECASFPTWNANRIGVRFRGSRASSRLRQPVCTGRPIACTASHRPCAYPSDVDSARAGTHTIHLVLSATTFYYETRLKLESRRNYLLRIK